MQFEFKKNLESDDNGYTILFDMVDEELKKRGIPTQANRRFRTSTGLITLKAFPFKDNSEEIAKLEIFPGIVRIKKGQKQLDDGKLILVVNVHINGLKMLSELYGEESVTIS